MNHAEPVRAEGQYLTFFVAQEEYAIDVLRVREVVEAVPMTRVPSAPRDVRGVVNLRGSVVPVIDLGMRFGGDELVSTARTCIVVVEAEAATDRVVGLLVDSVNRVVTLGRDDIAPVPPFGTRAGADLLGGMGITGPSFVLVLVADRVARIGDHAEGSPS